MHKGVRIESAGRRLRTLKIAYELVCIPWVKYRFVFFILQIRTRTFVFQKVLNHSKYLLPSSNNCLRQALPCHYIFGYFSCSQRCPKLIRILIILKFFLIFRHICEVVLKCLYDVSNFFAVKLIPCWHALSNISLGVLPLLVFLQYLPTHNTYNKNALYVGWPYHETSRWSEVLSSKYNKYTS